MTNNDTGDALASAVIDAAAGELGWPWTTTWSTPLWAVLVAVLGLVVLVALSGWLVIRRRRTLAWVTAPVITALSVQFGGWVIAEQKTGLRGTMRAWRTARMTGADRDHEEALHERSRQV